ncbi:MAG: helix-turn-helix domain-containing protein [Lachnospiraceae bacterium]|nr:helix-turn-helix domain-containing protein [Lachnospiraceae bacterium]
MKNKHLTFNERIFIEECLEKGYSLNKIAAELHRPSSTVMREVKRNRIDSQGSICLQRL